MIFDEAYDDDDITETRQHGETSQQTGGLEKHWASHITKYFGIP
jgi:hypothetical protein